MTADELERISNLPDKMAAVDLEREFSVMIDQIGNASMQGEPDVIMEALYELADRQWHCYALLRDDLRRKLSACILDTWDRTSPEGTENLIAIIARIGLADTMAQLVSMDPGSLHPRISCEIECADREFGDTVGDPYSGMRT